MLSHQFNTRLCMAVLPEVHLCVGFDKNPEIFAELLISRNITADESHMLEALIFHL